MKIYPHTIKAVLGVILLMFICYTLINNKSEVAYYTSENYDIIGMMVSQRIDKICSIPRSDAKVKTDGDFYIEYHKDIFGGENSGGAFSWIYSWVSRL